MDTTLSQNRRHARVTGGFFIMATVTAIIGLKLYDPILLPADYLVQGGQHAQRIALGAFFELLVAAANLGTAVTLYPYLKRFNESWGLAYVGFRILEVVFILIGITSVLALLSVCLAYTGGGDPGIYGTLGATLKSIYYWAFLLGPNFMLGINTFIYSYVFFRSRQLPRPLSVFGITGAVVIFGAALLQLFGLVQQLSPAHLILSLPVAVFEMVLAGWLIGKGVKQMPEPELQPVMEVS